MKIYRYRDRSPYTDLREEERAEAEAAAKQKFPDAEWVRAGLYGDRIYVEVHKAEGHKGTQIYGWRG